MAPTFSSFLKDYPLSHVANQRVIGPVGDCEEIPPPGSEIFVSRIPFYYTETELFTLFSKAGRIFKIRLMVRENFPTINRGYAYITYTSPEEAERAINDFSVRNGIRTTFLSIEISHDNCRLFVGGIPEYKTKDEVWKELLDCGFDGIIEVIMYRSYTDRAKNRGYVFVEFETHQKAAQARYAFSNFKLWGCKLTVDWSTPLPKLDDFTLAKIKKLFFRNLKVSESRNAFIQMLNYVLAGIPVTKVFRFKDYGFVHFYTRKDAEEAMMRLSAYFQNTFVEVTWAVPQHLAPRKRHLSSMSSENSDEFISSSPQHEWVYTNSQTSSPFENQLFQYCITPKALFNFRNRSAKSTDNSDQFISSSPQSEWVHTNPQTSSHFEEPLFQQLSVTLKELFNFCNSSSTSIDSCDQFISSSPQPEWVYKDPQTPAPFKNPLFQQFVNSIKSKENSYNQFMNNLSPRAEWVRDQSSPSDSSQLSSQFSLSSNENLVNSMNRLSAQPASTNRSTSLFSLDSPQSRKLPNQHFNQFMNNTSQSEWGNRNESSLIFDSLKSPRQFSLTPNKNFNQFMDNSSQSELGNENESSLFLDSLEPPRQFSNSQTPNNHFNQFMNNLQSEWAKGNRSSSFLDTLEASNEFLTPNENSLHSMNFDLSAEFVYENRCSSTSPLDSKQLSRKLFPTLNEPSYGDYDPSILIASAASMSLESSPPSSLFDSGYYSSLSETPNLSAIKDEYLPNDTFFRKLVLSSDLNSSNLTSDANSPTFSSFSDF